MILDSEGIAGATNDADESPAETLDEDTIAFYRTLERSIGAVNESEITYSPDPLLGADCDDFFFVVDDATLVVTPRCKSFGQVRFIANFVCVCVLVFVFVLVFGFFWGVFG